ncbi:MAG TPA: hypothetical protein VEA41_09905 [Salinarimonas sp.]|nr:hypothetical protein [Salinarimonas sp.]
MGDDDLRMFAQLRALVMAYAAEEGHDARELLDYIDWLEICRRDWLLRQPG